MKKVINVCAYARVSTDTRDQENSFDNQKNYFEREITKNPHYNLIEVYADKGLSATSMVKRDDFLRMVYNAGIDIDKVAYEHNDKNHNEQIFLLSNRKPKFERIFVKNTSRFARNIDAIDLLRKLRSKGVYVEFLDISKSTSNESDFVFIEMLLVFDENDSRDKSRKVKFGQLEGMKNGVVHVNSRLYGFKKIDKYNLEIIEDEAKVIRYIYELYANGDGVRVIIDKLTKKGYRTRAGKSFAKSSILNILKNEKYKGDNIRRKFTTGTVFVDKSNPKMRDEEDWIIHKDTIPPIVSDELWDKCEKIRLSRNVNQRGLNYSKNKLVGLLKCGKCGANYIKNVDKGRVFYNCSTKKQHGVKACDNINISEKILIENIEQIADGGFYQDIIHDKDVYISQLEEVAEKLVEKYNEGLDTSKLEKLNNQKKDYELQKNRLADLYLSAKVDMSYYDDKNNELTRILKKTEKEISYITSGKEIIKQEIEEVKESIKHLEEIEVKETYTIEEMFEELNSITIERHFDNPKEILVSFDYKILDNMNKLIEKYV